MKRADETPTYNLKAVVQETGLKPDTLRAWERRYGLPNPQRTTSGYRLYSQRDIDMLKWLVERQNEGLSISRAVALWHRLLEEGADPIRQQNSVMETKASAKPVVEVAADTLTPSSTEWVQISKLRNSWVSACLAFDEQPAESILVQAFSLFSPEIVCLEILQKGLAELGAGWATGQVTPHQEHFASSLAMRRLQSLLAMTPGPHQSGPNLGWVPVWRATYIYPAYVVFAPTA